MTSSNVSTDYINLRISDGTQMQAYLARPRNEGKLPGIMVFQEAFGVNAHIRDVTERFASRFRGSFAGTVSPHGAARVGR